MKDIQESDPIVRSIELLGYKSEVTLLTWPSKRQREESAWQELRCVWAGSAGQAREVVRSTSIAIRRWTLALLARVASVVTLAIIGVSVSAQTTQTYTEIVKPGFITGGGYNSVKEEFAVTQAWWAASCIANPGYSCVSLENLHACSNNTAYNWGEPQDWCWHFTRTAPNGVIESQGITGPISWTNACPTYPYFSTVVNQISGTGTYADPRVFKNRCERTVTRIVRNECGVGNPIYPASGTKRQAEQDYASASGLLTFTRIYNSAYGRFRHEYEPDFAPHTRESGPGCIGGEIWLGSQPIKTPRCFPLLNVMSSTAQALFTGSDGARDELAWDGVSSASQAPYLKNRLVRFTHDGTSGWLMTRPDERRQLVFDDGGRLLQVQRLDGASVKLTYAGDQLMTMEDDWGRTLRVSHGPMGISSLTDPAGAQTTYQYANLNKLLTVTYPDQTSKSYLWDEADLSTGNGGINRLTGIVDEANKRFASFGYQGGKAVSTEHAGGVDRFSMVDTRTSGVGAIALTYPRGSVYTTNYQVVNGFSRVVSSTQPAGSGCTAATSNIAYDANGNVESKDDFNSKRICYVNDLTRNVEITRVEGASQSTMCSTVTPVNAALPANTRKVSTEWHPDWRLSTRVAEPGRITTSIYNGQPDPFNANAAASCAPSTALLPDGKPIAVLCKQVEQASTDTDGHLGFSAALQSEVANRTSSWTYNQYGQVLTEDGPRTDVNDVTTYTYYSDTSFTGEGAAAQGHFIGDLQSVTNAAGKVTSYSKYNKHGQVLESSDANGVLSVNTYDLRQRLLSSSVGGQTTSYAYDAAGQLKKVTLPDSSWVGYDYDDAHRQVAVYDNKGNRTEYQLDNAGNRTGETTKDPSGNLKRQLTRSIDALGRVQQATGRE